VEKKHQLNLGYLLVALWLLLFQFFFGPLSRQADLSYDQFERHLEAGDIRSVSVDERFIRGEFRRSVDGKTTFVTPRLELALAEKLARYDVQYQGVVSNTFLANLVSWVAPTVVFALIWLFVFRKFADRQGLAGMVNIGKSKARVLMEKDTSVTFADVAGVDEAKAELMELVEFLKHPDRFQRLGAHIPKGVLLIGPPGTGKTLIARAVAGEAGVPFFSISGSEFVEMFVGVGAARVRDLFEQAKGHSPAIIFIDELDALGRARGLGPAVGGHDEREQTLNQLLSEMDGFDPAAGVVIMAATNRPEILDPALLRAGRFDRQVLVDRPDKNGRLQILRVHTRKITLDENIKLEEVAALTTGFSGADLANLVNEAAIVATRREAAMVNMDDFVAAIERLVAGLEKRSRLIDPQEKRIVACHELGHAFVALTLHPGQAIQKVSVIPRGIGALGYTLQRPAEDRYLVGRQELLKRMTILLAGRAAERLVFDEVTSGAADDLVKATDIARAMVMQYGMSDEIGLLSIDNRQGSYFLEVPGPNGDSEYGPDTAQKVAAAVTAFLDSSYREALAILTRNRALLEMAAEELCQAEAFNEEKMESFKARLNA
jgi:cell division protease FtsH